MCETGCALRKTLKNGKPIIGTHCELWLGTPLRTKKQVMGAIVVQSYSDPQRYTAKDAELLGEGRGFEMRGGEEVEVDGTAVSEPEGE